MVSDEDIAPAVRSILQAAADRGDPDADPISVEARSFPRTVADANAAERVPVIAEVKPTSPTTEGVRTDDPVRLARAMVDGGAAAISVLTEPAHFGGSPTALERVREAVDVPVLRKDFILAEHQLDVVAADIVLLIARFVDDLPAMLAAATERGFQVLVEVHTPAELRDAVDAGAEIVGINNRDLATLSVDVGTFGRTVESTAVPDEVLLVAESGIGSSDDVRRMLRAGADAVLIGTAIMDGDVRSNTRRMTGAAT